MLRNRGVSKIGRNDECPCGSGKKYKRCCIHKPLSEFEKLKAAYYQKHKIRLKDPTEIEKIRDAGKLAIELLELVETQIEPGITTEDIDHIIRIHTRKNHAISAPLNYKGFPKSSCVSVNEVICHGIPGERRLNDGDIVNVDVTPILDGFYADVNKTFFVGTPGPDARKIVHVALESLRRSMEMVAPGNTIGDLGWAIQDYAESEGCSVVREFVGHGVGFSFHEPPHVPHFGRKKNGIALVPGMVFTIEPMINLGEKDIHILEDRWTAVTKDGSLSAQFEQTLLVTPDGYESLTPYSLTDES